MKGITISNVTPQNKLVGVNNRFGNTNIKNQQGSTRVIFDSIEITGQNTFRFFENAGSRQYPFTNIGSEGNRLNVGETLVIQKIYFGIIEVDPDTGQYVTFTPDTTEIQIKFGEFNFLIANSQVLKQVPLTVTSSLLGVNNTNSSDGAFSTFTDIVIPPLLEYVLEYRAANYSAALYTNQRLVCFIEGTAGILAPQTTF